MHPVLLDWNWEMIVWSCYLQCRYIATEINAALHTHTHTHSFLGAYWIAKKRWETNVCCSIMLIVPNSSTLTLISLSAKTFFSLCNWPIFCLLSVLPPSLPPTSPDHLIWFGRIWRGFWTSETSYNLITSFGIPIFETLYLIYLIFLFILHI